MGNSIHRQMLAFEDQEAIIKAGAAVRAGGMEKTAQLLNQITDSGTKMLIAGSLITGIPIGIMAHMVHNKIRSKRSRADEMDARIKFYREAGQGIEDALAAQGARY